MYGFPVSGMCKCNHDSNCFNPLSENSHIPIFQYDLGIRQGETLPCEGCEDMLPWCVRCTVMPQALEWTGAELPWTLQGEEGESQECRIKFMVFKTKLSVSCMVSVPLKSYSMIAKDLVYSTLFWAILSTNVLELHCRGEVSPVRYWP